MSDATPNTNPMPPAGGEASINQLPDPAAFSAPPGAYKRKRHRREEEEANVDLNINSLLDILSVILVFLLKSYSSNTVQIKPSVDLQAPFSRSSVPPQESTAITVTLKNVLVNDSPVIKLTTGQVPENSLSSGGYLIDPLFAKLQEEVDHQQKIAKYNKNAEFKGIVTIIADRNVPFKLLTQVMYTAGQATYSRFKFAVIKSE